MSGHPDCLALRLTLERVIDAATSCMADMKAEWPEGDVSTQRRLLDIAVGLSTAKCSAYSLLKELERKEGIA